MECREIVRSQARNEGECRESVRSQARNEGECREVIDIRSVAANALWVLGLALILTALSWANWAAARERIPFRSALGRPGVRRALDGGLVLFCAGLAATGRTLWEQVLWGVLAVGFGVLMIWGERRITRAGGGDREK
ncbi:MAG: hypothetical protein ACK4WK_01755 [Anaerolineae bacterium]